MRRRKEKKWVVVVDAESEKVMGLLKVARQEMTQTY